MRLDLLLGRAVHDLDGRRIGHIQDMRGELREDGTMEIVEYHLGPHAFWKRLGISALRLVGITPGEPDRVPWDQMDISDPEKPVFKRSSQA